MSQSEPRPSSCIPSVRWFEPCRTNAAEVGIATADCSGGWPVDIRLGISRRPNGSPVAARRFHGSAPPSAADFRRDGQVRHPGELAALISPDCPPELGRVGDSAPSIDRSASVELSERTRRVRWGQRVDGEFDRRWARDESAIRRALLTWAPAPQRAPASALARAPSWAPSWSRALASAWVPGSHRDRVRPPSTTGRLRLPAVPGRRPVIAGGAPRQGLPPVPGAPGVRAVSAAGRRTSTRRRPSARRR